MVTDLVDGLSTRSLTTSPGMAAGSCCKLVRTARRSSTPKHGMEGRRAGNRDVQLSPAAGPAAVMVWWRGLQARVVQIPHRTNVGAVWSWPSRSPWQRLPAVTATAAPFSGGAALHRPLGLPQPVQFRRQRPGAVLQDTAGRRGCRTAGRGSGRPGSASRRSGGCTDGGRRASASTCSGGPCRSPSRARWRSPPVGGPSGRSRGATALGLVARLRPTHQAGGHGQAGAASRFHRTLPAVGPAGARSGCRPRPRPRFPARRSGRRRTALRGRADPPGLAG